MRNVSGLEALHRDYASKGVKFYFVYKSLSHPGREGYVDPLSLADRLAHIEEAKRRFPGLTMPWLCDNMSNDLRQAMGGLNNSEFVFDPDGKIVRMRDWSNPSLLRDDLQQLVGTVDKPTRASDLKIRFIAKSTAAARGVVPPIEKPSRMTPVSVTPRDDGHEPYYVKLRAEVEPRVLQTGEGKLYLDFQLDPVHGVHWNNLAAPIEYEITPTGKTSITPSNGTGPKVEAEADVDPRQFLTDIRGGSADRPIELTVRYFACSDEEGWCKPVTQKYTIHLKGSRAGGGRGGFGARFGGPPEFGGRRPGGRPPGGFSVERLMGFDRNEDGKVSRDELPQPMRERILGRADTNGDGAIDQGEAERLAEWISRGRAGRPVSPGGRNPRQRRGPM